MVVNTLSALGAESFVPVTERTAEREAGLGRGGSIEHAPLLDHNSPVSTAASCTEEKRALGLNGAAFFIQTWT